MDNKVLKPYFLSILMMVILTILISPVQKGLGLVNVAMIYLIPVLYSASKWGTGPALMAAAMGVLTFDFTFVPPVRSFTVADFRYVITFIIVLSVGLITGGLSTRLKKEVEYSRQREDRVAALYTLSRDIAAVSDLDAVLESVTRNIVNTIEGIVILMLPDGNGKLEIKASSNIQPKIFMNESELRAATWVFERGRMAGKGTPKMPRVAGLYLPLCTEQGIQGVLGIFLNNFDNGLPKEQLQLLEAYAGLTALSINRIKLAEQAREAQTYAESEKLRTALFNSLSHDLRTPLSSIIGAVTGLLEEENVYTPEARRDLLQTIKQGAMRMHRFVNNLLDMARLESGMLKLKKEWCDLQDIIGVVANRFSDTFRSRKLDIKLEPDLPLVQADFVLIEQVLINIIDNAIKYSPPESSITITAGQSGDKIEVSVIDRGHEVPEKDLNNIFDKFYRIQSPMQASGTGLGLAICKGFIDAHGGSIWAENILDTGVKITFTLPIDKGFPVGPPIMNEGDANGNFGNPNSDH